MNICIYGAASNEINKTYLDSVEKLGEEMAKRNHTLVFGGGANGCMGAAARGAYKYGGEIIGIAPTFFNVDGVLFEHCTRLVGTETMRERKQLLEEYSDAFVITPGGVGTMDEFFEIITLKQLARHKKAVVVYNVNGYYDELCAMLDKMIKEKFAGEKLRGLYRVYDNADELISYLEAYKQEDVDVAGLRHINVQSQENTK